MNIFECQKGLNPFFIFWRYAMEYKVRGIREDEWPLLEDFLYEAIYVPEGFEGEVPRRMTSRS